VQFFNLNDSGIATRVTFLKVLISVSCFFRAFWIQNPAWYRRTLFGSGFQKQPEGC